MTRRLSKISFSRSLGVPSVLAQGLSVGATLGLFVLLAPTVGFVGNETAIVYFFSALLFIPLVLVRCEQANLGTGAKGAYELVRQQAKTPLVFFVGWLQLGGLLAIGSALLQMLAVRLDFTLELFFGLTVDNTWVLIAVAVVALLFELMEGEIAWRARIACAFLSLFFFTGIIAWIFFFHVQASKPLPKPDSLEHWLSGGALFAATLWSIDIVLDHYAQLKSPARTALLANLSTLVITAALSVVGAIILVQFPNISFETWSTKITEIEIRVELLVLIAVLLLGALGLSVTFSALLRLRSGMAEDGFLPQVENPEGPAQSMRFIVPVLYSIIMMASANFLPSALLASLAAITALWANAILLLPYLRVKVAELSANRFPKLPFHPLIPTTCVGILFFLSLLVPYSSLSFGLVWLSLGTVHFLFYARKGRIAVRKDETSVGELEEDSEETKYRVMLCAQDSGSSLSAIRIGEILAAEKGGELIVVRVLRLIEQIPNYSMKRLAMREWEHLEAEAQKVESGSVPVRTIVRVSTRPAQGFLEAAAEYGASYILLTWPSAHDGRGSYHLSAVEELQKNTALPVISISGHVPRELARITLTSGTGTHSEAALKVAETISSTKSARLTLLRINQRSSDERRDREILNSFKEKVASGREVETNLARNSEAKEGILQASRSDELLIMGASVDPLLNQIEITGLPYDVARTRVRPTLIVKSAESVQWFWARRIWDTVSRPLPTLSATERLDVFRNLRRAARAGVDFYMLMILASAIAMFGLILNSGAIIIGAMLVAPLMSPILAVGQGVVLGNTQMIREGLASTIRGIGLAVGVSAIVSLPLPTKLPTQEILARAEPNIFDLLVAICAGGAAAYSVSRKSLSGALPGVAISVALVPPLCVVGYGLGTSRFAISAGALLLFVTNLSSIVLVGAVFFMLLGIRPNREGREANVRRAIAVSIASISALCIPLGFTTGAVMKQGKLESKIERVFETELAQNLRLQSFTVDRRAGEFIVDAIVFSYDRERPDEISKLQDMLSDRVGVPVWISATIVDAELIEPGRAVVKVTK